MNVNSNGQESIRLLEFPENIRKKHGMYLDEPSMLREPIDNATDEVISSGGLCNTIVVNTKDYPGYNLVADNGRGIPIQMSPDKEGKTQCEVAISYLHSGSKFVNTNALVGTYGVGLAAVNALSSDFWILSKVTPENYDKSIPEVKNFYQNLGPRSKKDVFYYLNYRCGYKNSEGVLKKKDLEKMIGLPKELPEGMSTIVLFMADETIFPGYKPYIPQENLTYFLFIQEKFYKRSVKILCNDVILTPSEFKPYKFEVLKTITPVDCSKNPYLGIYATFEVDSNLSQKSSKGSVNSLVVDNGVHLSYIETCYMDALKAEYKINHKTLLPGLKLKVILLAEDLIYDSQIKSRLKSISKVKQSDFSEITREFQKIFRKNDDYWRPHVEKLNALAESYRSIGAVEKAQKMIDASKGNSSFRTKAQNYVEGFSDATTTDRWKAELFLCEGLSAAGGLKAGRKSTLYHAILPLRGKILNVKDSTVDEALANKEIFTMLSTIGLGIDINFVGSKCTTPEETYAEIQKHSRYGKVVLTADSD